MQTLPRISALAYRAAANVATHHPLCVSFEITHNCNARCGHCHRGRVRGEVRATPERFGEIYRELHPPAVQISGGEPLTRRDVEDIIQAIRQPSGIPFVVFVTNGALLTRDRFRRLRSIGVDQFSISLDFPDQRHDLFRAIPGLFARICGLLGGLKPPEQARVTFNTVVMSTNVRELLSLAELALTLGVTIDFSPYTWMRTGDRTLVPQGDDLRAFEDAIEKLMELDRQHALLTVSEAFLRDMVRFFREGGRPRCRAGERFLVVNPDGTLSPCGLIPGHFSTQAEMLEGFTRANACTACNTSIRASTEHPFSNLLRVGFRSVRA
jgi:MoaA/NifB/PqqE/SkfB family radical SAM enzyme